MKRTILLLLAAPVVGFLAVKLYIHIQVGRTVEAMIAQARPVADISYERVTSGVDGRVGLKDVVIRPVGVNDQVRIGEVSVKLPSMLYLLTLEDKVNRRELPESLSVKVHDVAVSTRGELAKSWEQAAFADDPDGRERAYDNCVTRTKLPTQMYLLDYDEIRGSFELGYRYDRHNANLVLHARAGQIDGIDFDGELALVMDAFDIVSLGETARNPEIARATMHITDDGYFQRIYAYCEKDDDLPRATVAAMLTRDLLRMFDDLPLKPDEPLMEAYAAFVDGGSSLLVTAEPREPRKLQYLSLYEPTDVPALLNINARVN